MKIGLRSPYIYRSTKGSNETLFHLPHTFSDYRFYLDDYLRQPNIRFVLNDSSESAWLIDIVQFRFRLIDWYCAPHCRCRRWTARAAEWMGGLCIPPPWYCEICAGNVYNSVHREGWKLKFRMHKILGTKTTFSFMIWEDGSKLIWLADYLCSIHLQAVF